MRKVLVVSLALTVFCLSYLGTGIVRGQAAAPVFNNCAGAFTPNLNCILSGQFNFTNTSSVQGTSYATPFAIGGTSVMGTAADLNTIHTATVTLTNAQVVALQSTGFTVIPAPPLGYIVRPIGGLLEFNYTGAYSSTDSRLYYGDRTTGPAASSTITGSICLNVSADTVCSFSGVPDDETVPASTTVPKAVVLQGKLGTTFGSGNAANTVTVKVQYLLYPLTGF